MAKIMRCKLKEYFGPFNMLTVHNGLDTGIFRHLNNPTFCNVEFQNEISSDTHLFFQSISNVLYIPEMQQKIQKIFLDFEIIAFQLVALDTRFY